MNRFESGSHTGASPLFEFRRRAHKRFPLEALCRLWIVPSFLHHHAVKLLVHIDSKSVNGTDSSCGELDHRLAQIKLRAGSLV